MKLTDHIRLIWPTRHFIAVGNDITFHDGQPMPTQTELNATLAQAEALFAAEQVPPNPPPPPPTVVTLASLKIALGYNLCVQIGAWINSIQDTEERFRATTWWKESYNVRRNHPTVETFRQAMNKTEAEVDAWFAAAQIIDNA
jgi:hypothetical protein